MAKTSFAGAAAWIDGRYKLLMSRGKKASRYKLYDLDADRGEAKNIASLHPEKVNTMVKQLNAWRQSVENSLTGTDYAK